MVTTVRNEIGAVHWMTNNRGKPASYLMLARGDPKATDAHSVESLKEMGLRGWYAVVNTDGEALWRDGSWSKEHFVGITSSVA